MVLPTMAVVQAADEHVDVVAVEGGDEGPVESGQDGVDILVPLVLDGLETLGILPVGAAGLEHLIQDAAPLDDLLRDPVEMGEIEIVLGQELFEHLDLLHGAARPGADLRGEDSIIPFEGRQREKKRGFDASGGIRIE